MARKPSNPGAGDAPDNPDLTGIDETVDQPANDVDAGFDQDEARELLGVIRSNQHSDAGRQALMDLLEKLISAR